MSPGPGPPKPATSVSSHFFDSSEAEKPESTAPLSRGGDFVPRDFDQLEVLAGGFPELDLRDLGHL
jgi:hypothetical protein